MQGHSTILEQPATERSSAQDTHVGRRVVFVASDLTDDDVEELKQQDLLLWNDDEDEDEEGEEPGKGFKGRTIPSNDDFREFHVHGISTSPGRDLKIDCKLDVMTVCDRKDSTVVKHYMKLEYLQLQLPNYIDKDEHKGHFVHRIIVSAKPTEEWRPKINRMFAEPSDESHPTSLTFQESSTTGVGGSVASTGVVQGQASYSTSKALSYSETEYGWSRAEVDDYPDQTGNLPSWSVKWTWNLKYWKGGRQEFNQEKPWKFSTPFKISKPWEYFSKPLPQLPYFSRPDVPRIGLSNLQENLAEWRSSPEVEGKRNIEWDVEVQLFTAKLQKREWSITNGLKRSYEAETFRPGQLTRITKRVTVRN